MSKKDEALKLALEALENLPEMCGIEEAITAVQEALAEQPAQQEPVACPDGRQCKHGAWCTETYCQEHCEFRAPPQRKPLTDEEIWDEVKAADLDWQTGWSLDEDASNRYITFARAIEAAHGIKEKRND